MPLRCDFPNGDAGKSPELKDDKRTITIIESRRIDLEFTEIEVEFLLNKAIANLRVQAEDKNINLKIEDFPSFFI